MNYILLGRRTIKKKCFNLKLDITDCSRRDRLFFFFITPILSLQQSVVKTVHTYGIYKKTLVYFTWFYFTLDCLQFRCSFFSITEDNLIRCFLRQSTIHILTSNHKLCRASEMSNFPCFRVSFQKPSVCYIFSM